jgi:GR25 family glycosyltransferase involved in LPS biosynthesis
MYQGFFINLDRSEDRRQSLIGRLATSGAAARYQRFPGVDGRACPVPDGILLSPGEMGCWQSHLGLLNANRHSNCHLHVIEDDIVFAKGAVGVFDDLLRYADAQIKDWDLIFTDIFVPVNSEFFFRLRDKLSLHRKTGAVGFLDLYGVDFASLCSYFVNRRSIGKLADLLDGKWTERQGVDVYLRTLTNQKQIKAFVIVPFLTSLAPDGQQSEIRDTDDLSRQVWSIYRRAFFKDADIQSLSNEMNRLVNNPALPPLDLLFLSALRFRLSDQLAMF